MKNSPEFILKNNIPNHKLLSQFAEDLYNNLFPISDDNHFTENTDVQLEQQLTVLVTKVCSGTTIDIKELVNKFLIQLPNITQQLIVDANYILNFDPAAKSIEEVIFCYPGFYTIAMYRVSHLLYILNIPLLPRMISELAHSKTGIDIHPGATIGCPFFIDHGTGIVIGETTIIGNNVRMYQSVTLGALAVRKEEASFKRHPTIEDNVVIYAGSTILGGNTIIGHDSVIGGNTWITETVPPFSIVYHNKQSVIKDKRDFKEPINFII